ncbi:MAG: VanZ family protein [Bacteroidales bacterium]|nr:VanZ family protein [Bacteroidales bacterium]
MIVNNSTYFALVEEQLADGKKVQITLKGISMYPTLHNGDTLLLEPLTEAPAVGDVVLFRYHGLHLLHRVVAADGDLYTMQGDNCYVKEQARRADIVARLVQRQRKGKVVTTDSRRWARQSRCSLMRKKAKHLLTKTLNRDSRRKLRVWYFAALAILMWAPLNGVGIPLDNYVLGIRTDHLLHASVFIPCALFYFDMLGRKRGWAWLAAVLTGMVTEGGQWLLPYRGFDINDLIANAFGVTLGWLLMLAALRRGRQAS